MVVGSCRIDLYIPGNGSLKGKRRVVKSIIGRVRGRFNVAAAEVEENDKWQRAVIGVVTVSNDKRMAESVLSKVVDLVRSSYEAEIVDYTIEIL